MYVHLLVASLMAGGKNDFDCFPFYSFEFTFANFLADYDNLDEGD